MRLEDCPNGTRFFTFLKCRPNTLVTCNKKKSEAIYRAGHKFNPTAIKYRITSARKVWAITNGVY